MVRCVFGDRRVDGSISHSSANTCVLLKKRMTPRGKDLFGPISARVKKKRFSSSFAGIV